MVELNFKPGDAVRLRLSDKEIDVIILESNNPEIVLVKLESGYNIGIKKENILATRKLPSKEVKEKELSVETKEKDEKALPKIAVVVTGGTIASKIDYKTRGVEPIKNPE
jgi:glutamyl-tRNA(Gln) amidotransferase subunit D